MQRKLRMGMVGGGRGAFIGGVHRFAAALDQQIELVCGAFSSDPEKSRVSGKDFYLPAERVYGSYEEMIRKEKELPEGDRMDFISIVTPNHVHFGPAKMALENGFHVVCDKPLAFSVDEARQLVDLVEKTGLVFALTHNYTGYPMVKQARHMVKEGKLGKIRKIVVEYPQGWLANAKEETDNKQASWRTDPSKSGLGGAMGDIGTHAENLAEYISGLKITEVCADLTAFVEGRRLDDDANILLRFEKEAKGVLHCSQIAVGEENGLNIRIWGETGGLEWHQQEPNTLIYKRHEQPAIHYRTGVGELSAAALAAQRVPPPGHPEGYLEAFGNIYKNFAATVGARMEGRQPTEIESDFPTVHDGLRGMRFVEIVVENSRSNEKWSKV
ncbi:Gfo/Idh/MocA family protein [Lewinella sp. JB7]|uniref:Gfo/Idh/MocA family protein n=1 Tax=Lewinella sp. JB7 TaxID=2962887 RepID=UPI0020CA2195|nr:Gfo/Idh/MocA family oxidoreductase [Lewinella sp. JB7]MCP9234977.1 Gfo/Idh/MocA family oxidoreductase [Lewinella sp. JB7]